MTSSPEKDNCSSQTSSSAHYALQVALQTMKERCQSLQKRLTLLEEENLSLRMAAAATSGISSSSNSASTYAPVERRVSNQTELEVLREKVSELSRQKVQLMDHISMVAGENRQLWSRLSKLTKETQQRQQETIGRGGQTAAQNLIRSKTFTKSSAPNPKLREKLPRNDGGSLSPDVDNQQQQLNPFELEDIELVNRCGFVDGGTSVEMGFLQQHQESPDDLMMLMFDVESHPDAKRCTESLLEIQKELLRQQTVLRVATGKLQIRKEKCQSCRNRVSDMKPVMVDKTVEVESSDLVDSLSKYASTEDIPLPEVPKQKPQHQPSTDTTTSGALESTNSSSAEAAESEASPQRYVDLLQEKIKADAKDKMCPMCGKVYVKNSPFNEFQDHVESHFVDTGLDSGAAELSMEFEYLSQVVGNF